MALPPTGGSAEPAEGDARLSPNAGDSLAKRDALSTATSSRTAAAISSSDGGTDLANPAVTPDPKMAPIVAPAEITPKSLLPCSGLKRSTLSCQKTETTKRL